MKKRFIIGAALIILSLLPFVAGGCGISRFVQYEYSDGVMILLDGDGASFSAEINFITSHSLSSEEAEEIDEYLLSQLKNFYGDFIEANPDGNYYQMVDIYGQNTGKIIFKYFYFREVLHSDTDYYRYDPNFIKLTDAEQSDKFFYKNYTVKYQDPFWNGGYYLSASYLRSLFNDLSMFENNYKILLACARRDNIYNGELVAIDGVYYAEFDRSSYRSNALLGYSFSDMVSWVWYTLVIIITTIIVGLILLFAKKEKGAFVYVKEKQKPKYTAYRAPYSNPYNQNPYQNPYQNPQNQNPFGNQYNNTNTPPQNQNPYQNPNQQPFYGQPQQPYQPPYGQQPKPARPDDVFPEFSNQGSNDKNDDNQNNNNQ